MPKQNPLSAKAKEWIQKPIKQDIHLFMLRHPEVFVQVKVDHPPGETGSSGRVLAWRDHSGNFRLVTPHNGVYTYDGLTIWDDTILDCEFHWKTGTLYIFDILWLQGRDVRPLPLSQRLLLLPQAIVKIGPKAQILGGMATRAEEEVQAYYDRALEDGYEGIVVKDLHAPYGAAASWAKKKRFEPVDVFVTGTYVTPKGNIGYNMSLFDDEGSVHYVGDVYSAVETVDKGKIQVGSVLQVSYQPTEGFSKLRHPTIERVRDDKTPEECLLSQLQ